MDKLLLINKPIGLTPLQVIKKLKQKRKELQNTKMTYAGRLDPLAHGILLLLIGEETKEKQAYLLLPKTYEFEVVFGLQTDTYDLLGYLKEIKIKQVASNVNIIVNTFVKSMLGKNTQAYPPYSSKPVNGKPLFLWAKEGKLAKITLPQHEIEIYDFQLISFGKITSDALQQRIVTTVALVNGDFRQKLLVNRWMQFFSQINNNEFLITAKFRIHCSSGTYVRQLVHQMGEQLGCGAIAIDILRTRVGSYTIKDAKSI